MSKKEQKYPVIVTTGLMDGDWTHTWVDADRIQEFVSAILTEYDESDLSPDEFTRNLGISVDQMTKPEFEEIPEL